MDEKEPLVPLLDDLPLSQASNNPKQELIGSLFQRQPYAQLPFSTVKETHPKGLMGSTPLGMPQQQMYIAYDKMGGSHSVYQVKPSQRGDKCDSGS